MSLPTTAPAASAASQHADARHVSTEIGTSNRSRQRLDRRHDPIQLLLLADLGPGPGLDAAHVEEVGAVGHELRRPWPRNASKSK